MGFGVIGKTYPAQNLWDVQSFADSIGKPVKGVFAFLLPIVERCSGCQMKKGAGSRDEGMTKGIIVEDAMQICAEDPGVGGNTTIDFAIGEDGESLSLSPASGLADMNLITADPDWSHWLSKEIRCAEASGHLPRGLF